jgi:tetratricopeptide (TPR) repeat protein
MMHHVSNRGLGAFFTILFLAASPAGAQAVKVHEESVVIPTYLIGPPDPNPQFYFGGNSQGAQHRIYPYPVYDNLTTEKVDKTYKMVYLENEFIRIGILPEIGGKVFEAVDKTNGYNFIYRQHVIKPALISLLGAWISGGIEWDVPHHHRATSFLPVQYSVEDQPDGSKTVWVGELELRDRMRWGVGLTLHPGKSYLQAEFRMINRTPLPTSMLCFSNVAVSVNDSYQVIFPPSTQHVTYHAKRDFTTWPIATTRFNNADFTAGVDVSWYKNHYSANSMFAWNYQDDFFAGYDHRNHAGTMSIADHNVVPGKKFWTWGNGPSGRAEDTLLTDSDGPYIELMVGAYSDNQPDYTWLQPFETRTWTQYWYPFRDIDGVKNANTDAAVNLDVKDGKANFGFCCTSEHPSATVTLTASGKALVTQQVDIGPGNPFVGHVDLPPGTDEHDVRAAISADGKELVAYSPIRLQPEAMPARVTSPPPPEEIKTNEELYLTGLRIEQFHAPAATPLPYWEEALKRDPGDIRVNTAVGIDEIKAGRFSEAEAHLRKALERATAQYTSPKDGEPFYYLGLALKAQGRLDEAYTQFFKSTWSSAWRGPGYFSLAQIDCQRGDFDAALNFDRKSINANALSIRSLTLYSAILRHQGHIASSRAIAAESSRIDPLDVDAMTEQWLAGGPIPSAAFRDAPSAALEAATDYMNAGLWSDATAVLNQLAESPLVDYDLAYCAEMRDQPAQAVEFDQKAAAAPTDYVFPFQMEMIDVFNHAMKANPSDSRAPYYLGNLLYDWQPDAAEMLWKKSAGMGADFPVVYRNLALVESRRGDPREVEQANLESAARFGGNAMVFTELDKLYEAEKVSPEKRLAVLQAHQSVINRDEIISREINLEIFAGQYDSAIALLQSRFFRAWEGGGRFSLGDSWINAHLLRGRQHLKAGQFDAALADFQSASQMPANLQDATGDVAYRNFEIAYWTGVAYDAAGQADKAKQYWLDATGVTSSSPAKSTTPTPFFAGRGRGPMGGLAPGVRVSQAAIYFKAAALRKLGETDGADALFKQLIDTGHSLANSDASADAHYLIGLGELGLNNVSAAKAEFALALESAPDHLAAKMMQDQM